jgi:protein-tyrosine phosphatase
MSLEMAEMAISEGITHIVCTPHASNHWRFDPERNRERVEELRSHLGNRIQLGLGCDFHVSYDNVQDALAHPEKYSINGKGYLLVELPDHGIALNLTDTFYELQVAGLTPILTHPERNPTLLVSPQRMIPWMRRGLLLQITAGSIIGAWGKASEKMAHKLLADGWVSFVATDAHDTKRRPPMVRKAYDTVAAKYGEEMARILFVVNPRAAFNGVPVPEPPDPAGVFEDGSRSWWQRLLGR